MVYGAHTHSGNLKRPGQPVARIELLRAQPPCSTPKRDEIIHDHECMRCEQCAPPVALPELRFPANPVCTRERKAKPKYLRERLECRNRSIICAINVFAKSNRHSHVFSFIFYGRISDKIIFEFIKTQKVRLQIFSEKVQQYLTLNLKTLMRILTTRMYNRKLVTVSDYFNAQ